MWQEIPSQNWFIQPYSHPPTMNYLMLWSSSLWMDELYKSPQCWYSECVNPYITIWGDKVIYSPTPRWFYQWKWQCSKSWSHSQNSLCSQISIRGGCACGMLDRGCLLWFTTVYYYVNGKTRRVQSRGRLLLSVDHAHMAWSRVMHGLWLCTWRMLATRSIRARMQSRRRCILLWLGKYWISRGRNVLLQGNSWRLRFDGLSLRFWQKNKLVRYAHSCVF